MNATPLSLDDAVDRADLPKEVHAAVAAAFRMASDREGGHARCPRRACRNASRRLGRPETPGQSACAAPLTPFAFGHGAKNRRRALRLIGCGQPGNYRRYLPCVSR